MKYLPSPLILGQLRLVSDDSIIFKKHDEWTNKVMHSHDFIDVVIREAEAPYLQWTNQ